MLDPTPLAPPVRTGRGSGKLIFVAASAGCALTVLDANVVAVILPGIASEFRASFADVQWVISAYVLCFASLLLPAGSIADRFGRRRVYVAGLLGFAIASFLCGAAPTSSALYLARAAQGVGAAFMLAPALAIIAHFFHEPAARDRAWALWGGIMGATMVLAPILGGLLAAGLGWRWAFYLNVPVCVLLGVACVRIPESRADGIRPLDPPGILLFATTMFAVTWTAVQGQAHGWVTMGTISGFAVAVASAAMFVVVEARRSEPMIEPALFRSPRLVAAVLAMFAYAACAQVMATLLPQYLQNGAGMSALGAGVAMLPFAVAMLVFPYVGRWLGRRVTSFGLLSIGLAAVGCGDALVACGAWYGRPGVLFCGMVLLGSGGGVLNGETQKGVMNNLPHGRAGIASGISTTARFSGILLGFGLLSSVLGSVVRGTVTRSDPAFGDAVAAGSMDAYVSGMTGSAAHAALVVARHAYASGFGAAMSVAAALGWGAALLVRSLSRRG